MHRFWQNYRQRHRHPLNIALHVIGLPLTFIAPIPLLVHVSAGWAAAAFVAGYALQFAGHAIEGNDAGEVILVKRMLGMPYVDIVERPNRSTSNGPDADT
jgi:uncharacterized membrane protein YGL010W